MRAHPFVLSLVATIACATPAAEVETASAPSGGGVAAAAVIAPENLARHVQTLASDAYRGRGPATVGED